MASGYSLKDQLFNLEKTGYLAGRFAAVDPGFRAEAFVADVMTRLPQLELKDRIQWISDVLGSHLPGTLPETSARLLAALPAPLDPTRSDDDFGDFIFAPLGEYVVAKGLQDHPDLSLMLLAEITQRFSMEWAIRPFINHWPDLALQRLTAWAAHENYHVRRLASEGTRPRLPWGQAVALSLTDPLPILDILHADRTRYVTRSVANHLNDISKKQPDLVLERLQSWRALGRQNAKELEWMTSHALRGLIKAGHPEALRMVGYDPEIPVEARLTLPVTDIQIGTELEMHCALKSPALELPVLVDYRIHFKRPSGKTTVKVFKLKKAALKDGYLQLTKTHKIKGNATTFTLVPGAHLIELMVNGVVCDSAVFDLCA